MFIPDWRVWAQNAPISDGIQKEKESGLYSAKGCLKPLENVLATKDKQNDNKQFKSARYAQRCYEKYGEAKDYDIEEL